MAGPAPQNEYTPYNPSPQGIPETDAPRFGRFDTHADASAFGGQIGQATEGFGQNVEKVGDLTSQLALHMQIQQNATDQLNATTAAAKEIGEVENNFRQLNGVNTTQGYGAAQQQIYAIQAKYSQQFTGDAQRGFLQDIKSYADRSLIGMGLHAGDQADKAMTGALQSSIVTDSASQAQHYVDTGTPINEDSIKDKSYMLSHHLGYETPQADAAAADAIGEAHAAVIKTLLNKDPLSAQTYFDAQVKDGKIPPVMVPEIQKTLAPQVKDAQSRGTADAILANFNQNYNNTLVGLSSSDTPKFTNIADAINSQESGGKTTSVTSVDGAKGGMQILPATFAQYAKPGESIDNPTDNQAVGRRIINDYAQRWPNDPARVAVAYFSGPGNVSPVGSQHPWINDAKDGNGASVSAYVMGIQNKMGGNPPNQADYYRANEMQILQQARAVAEQEHPDDPHYADMVVARVQQHGDQMIQAQTAAYKSDSDLVYRAFTGDLSQGQKPTSIDQLIGASPDVKAAWGRMLVNNPQTANVIQNQVISANAKDTSQDVKTYGTGFYDLFKAIHAPVGDPARITDPAQLYSHVGDNGDITMSGLDKLTKEISAKGTPDGEAESMMKKQFFANAKSQISGADEGLHIKDPKGEELFLKFMAQAIPAYDTAKANGKTPAQLLNPDSPDYVGKSIASFKRPMAQWTADMVQGYPGAIGSTADSAPRGLNDIIQDVQSGKLDSAAGKAEAQRLGLVGASAPDVPMGR